MTTKEMIVAEIGALDENDLSDLYRIVRQFSDTRKRAKPPSLMSKLKRVSIDAPPDFAANLDLYLSGEKNVR
jgi:hypothetical protein